eukprot:GHVQ01029418.1.p1 GENE.GHVQ01029418.1~~GHVQ01029418.1.p1  ORF type:complete len:141 (+),score=14.52 GHVQ01029418.1:310-732(+)
MATTAVTSTSNTNLSAYRYILLFVLLLFNMSITTTQAAYNFKLTNSCSSPVQVAIHYRNQHKVWSSMGWWHYEADESAFLSAGGNRLESTNSIWYWYAEATDNSGERWTGPHDIEVNGKVYPMRKSRDTEGHNDWTLTCV